MTWGVNYTAIAGAPIYVEWACFSAKTIKKIIPDVRTSLYTNKPDMARKCQWMDDVLEAPDYAHEDWQGAKIDGILASEKLGYDVTLHADADTVFLADVSDVFGLMETGKFDLATTITRDQRKRRYPMRGVHDGFSFHNNGVIFFVWNDATRKFFKDWHDFFHTHKVEFASSRKVGAMMHTDLPAYNEALYENSDLRLVHLPIEFNEQFWTGCVYQKVRVIHVHGAGGKKGLKMGRRLNENWEKPRLFRDRQIL